jgi:hypothetical protein
MKAVHHIDGDQRNNDPSNLRVVETKANRSEREMFIVETKDGEYPRMFMDRGHAEAYCALQNYECKTMAPHRVVRFVEVVS